jgi:PAS domain S-box-containing protein
MTDKSPTGSRHSGAEVTALVKTLHETHERLRTLTGGEVDAVLHSGGQSYLLVEAQQRLHDSEERFRGLFAAASIGIAIALPDGRYLQANPAYCRMLGYTEEELHQLTFASVTHPDDLASNREYRDQLLSGERDSFTMEKRYLRKGGAVVWVRHDVSATHGPAGEITTLMAIAEDITERKITEDALRHSEERLRLITNLVPHGIFAKDSAGRHIFANLALAEFAGIPVEEIIGKDDLELVRDRAQAEAFRADDLTVLQSGRRLDIPEEPRTDLSGRTRFLHTIKIPFTIAETGEPAVLGICMDITERKRTDARFRRLVDANVQGVFFWNTSGQITDANDRFLGMIGYSRADLEAGRVSWAMMTPSEYAEQDERALREIALSGMCEPFEKEFIRRDGTRVSIMVGPATFDDNPEEGFCFVLDLTERKKLEQQFLRAQRLESIGTLAGGIAHDLNNILGAITLSVDLLKLETDRAKSEEILKVMALSTQRGADIVRQVLSFARGMESKRIEVQPKHLLKELQSLITDTFPKDIRLIFSIPDDTWTILADPTQVHQILLNLCVNARDAMPDGGNLTVSAENQTMDQHYSMMDLQAKAGRYVCISVTDTGSGIPQKIIHRIFEPFFTTKEVNKGTGLGLSTVMAIVKSHEGMANVYSEPGKGTTFKVYLPVAQKAAEAEPPPTVPIVLPRGRGETILVVDDETSILAVTRQTLEGYGYRVLSAHDGAEALAVYVEKRNEVAVVLTDIRMPIMDGGNLIRVLLRINPLVRIVTSSGFSSNAEGSGFPEAAVKHFLNKPYTAQALLTTLRAILDEG